MPVKTTRFCLESVQSSLEAKFGKMGGTIPIVKSIDFYFDKYKRNKYVCLDPE